MLYRDTVVRLDGPRTLQPFQGKGDRTMRCAFCEDEIVGKPVRQQGQNFCSLECANFAAGLDSEDEDYFDEQPVGAEDDDD